jgi:Icc-related predicted phosphoesterase
MVIVGFADVHGSISSLDSVSEAVGQPDVLLLVGDFTHFGGENEARRIVQAVQPNCGRLLAVPGNCDRPEVGPFLEREGVSLHGHGLVIEGVAFVGVGQSLPCPGRTPNGASEDELAQRLDHAVSEVPQGLPLILVAHQPPFGTLNDVVYSGRHVGSTAVREFIEKHQPLVCFTGHIHEGVGIDSIGATEVINPGPLQVGGYAYAEINGDEVAVLEIRGLG